MAGGAGGPLVPSKAMFRGRAANPCHQPHLPGGGGQQQGPSGPESSAGGRSSKGQAGSESLGVRQHKPRVPAHLPSHQQPTAKLHPHSAPVTQGANTKISPSTKPLRSWEQEITTGTGPAPHRGSACPGGPWSPPVLRVHSYTLVLNLPGFFPRIIKYI